jgi:transposase-like protein
VSERAAPFHCPYCGDEDLRPSEEGGHGSWECTSCRRAFQLKFLGLLSADRAAADQTTSGGPSDDHRN